MNNSIEVYDNNMILCILTYKNINNINVFTKNNKNIKYK